MLGVNRYEPLIVTVVFAGTMHNVCAALLVSALRSCLLGYVVEVRSMVDMAWKARKEKACVFDSTTLRILCYYFGTLWFSFCRMA